MHVVEINLGKSESQGSDVGEVAKTEGSGCDYVLEVL
jgi:hypothetical protein